MYGYRVYRNDQFVKFIEGRGKTVRKEFIKSPDCRIGTHMGEWVCVERAEDERQDTWEYATTVGIYYKFVPAVKQD